MSMPFYVSPEQVMADKAEFARKGISRGKSIVALEYDGGVALISENATTLSKIGEIYDRIAFAGVGKFSEFDTLRKIGVRFADSHGYAYSRDDVRGKALANAYSQAMGEAFTREMKPLEVEIIVAEVGDDSLAGHENSALYVVKFDGFISDQKGYCVIGGNAEDVRGLLESEYSEGLSQEAAVRLGLKALKGGATDNGNLDASTLEVCALERSRTGRKFVRLSTDEVQGMLDE